MLSPCHLAILSSHISSSSPLFLSIAMQILPCLSCSQYLPPHFSHGPTPQKCAPSKLVANVMCVELDITKVVLEWIRMLWDSHWIILVSFAIFCMFYYSFFVLVSFVILTSSPLVAFTIGLKFYCIPFAPAPTVAQRQPFNFALSLFTGCSLFAYNAVLPPAGLVLFVFHSLFPTTYIFA